MTDIRAQLKATLGDSYSLVPVCDTCPTGFRFAQTFSAASALPGFSAAVRITERCRLHGADIPSYRRTCFRIHRTIVGA